MKKILLFASIAAFLLLIILVSLSIYLSFFKIKPLTQTINNKIEDRLSQVVFIPKGIHRPAHSFNSTSYRWEMETPQKEVVAIDFIYTPAFLKSEENIVATLKMAEGGDPSIFVKSLPALIKDVDSLKVTANPKELNPKPTDNALYKTLSLTFNKASQATSIKWEFDKSTMGQNIGTDYNKLEKYPTFILKFLYGLPQFFIDIFSGA